jgi:hypothetical protein
MGARRKPRKKRRSRKAKVPLLRGTELVKDPKLRRFNFNRCSDEQLRVLIGTFDAWRNQASTSQVEAALSFYWRTFSTISVTRMAEIQANPPVVENMTLDELEGFGFLLASHKNVVDLTEGKSFSEALDTQYKALFYGIQTGWKSAASYTGDEFFPALVKCYKRWKRNVFGVVIADDYPESTPKADDVREESHVRHEIRMEGPALVQNIRPVFEQIEDDLGRLSDLSDMRISEIERLSGQVEEGAGFAKYLRAAREQEKHMFSEDKILAGTFRDIYRMYKREKEKTERLSDLANRLAINITGVASG